MDAPTPAPIAKPRIFSWRLPLVLIITAVVLYVLWTHVGDRDAVVAALRSGDASLVALTVVMMALAILLSVQRMRFMLRAIGHRVPLRVALRAVMSTWPFAVVAPSRLNELLRAVVLRDHVPIAAGAGAIVAERVVDVQNLCLLAAIGGAATGHWESMAFAATGFAAVWGGGIALAARPDFFTRLPLLRRKADKVRQLVGGFEALRANPACFAGVAVFSLLVWASSIGMISVLLLAFGATVPLGTVVALWPLAIFAGLLPLTLSGVGTRDAAFVSLLAVSGFAGADELVLSATIVYAVVSVFLPALAGIPWMVGELSNFRQAWS